MLPGITLFWSKISMKILVTGGFGFIGSYLVNSLIKHGFEKIGILSRSIPSFYNTAEFNNVEILISDIVNKIDVRPESQYDVLIHLASANDVDSQDGDYALKANALGTKNVLDFCLNNKIKKIIYLSTFQVYGKDSGYISEESDIELKNHYALSHYFAEKYVEFYYKKYQIDYLILRPTNVYGGMTNKEIDRWSLVPGCFCKEAYEKGKITLLSSGKQNRNFVSQSDIFNTLMVMLNKFNEIRNSIYNLASNECISILEIAEIVKKTYMEMFNKHCEISITNDLPFESTKLTVDTQKLRGIGVDLVNGEQLKKEIVNVFNLLKE